MRLLRRLTMVLKDTTGTSYAPRNDVLILLRSPHRANIFLHGQHVSLIGLIFLLLFSGLLISGCVSLPDPETSQIHDQEVIATLPTDGTPIGQTFTSRRSGLNSLTIWVSSEQADAEGSLQVDLFHSPAETTPIYRSTLSTGGIGSKQPVRIAIPSQSDPAGQSYYLRLHATGKSLQVYGRAEDIYSPGNFFEEDIPVSKDIAFRTTYDYGWRAYLGDLDRWLGSVWEFFILALLLMIPGWFLLDLCLGLKLFDFGEKIALSVGASLAFIPVAMLWTSTIHLRWTSTLIWGMLALMVAILLIRQRTINSDHHHPPISPSPYPHRISLFLRSNITSISLLVIFLISLSIRLIMVRDYATPAWVDSVHHGLITRLILENGGFPASYAPYLDVQATEYHPGFHSLLAAFVWISYLDIGKAMLILGQVLNALTIFSAYLFANTLLSDRCTGLIAAAITGLFTPMPAYYASWGRYTHLAGMLVLPAFFVLFKNLIEHFSLSKDQISDTDPQNKFEPRGILPFISLSFVSGGLFLLHYRVAAFGILLAVSYVVFSTTIKWRTFGKMIGSGLLALLFAFGLILPWFLPTLTQTLLPKLVLPAERPPLFSGFVAQYLTFGMGQATLVLAIFGSVLGISLRRRFAFILLLWIALLLLLPNLAALGLPGGFFVNFTAVEISLYLPISVLEGFFLSQFSKGLRRVLPKRWEKYFQSVILVVAMVLLFIGARKTVTILNPVTVLSRQPDLTAMAWIKTNLPAHETIAINLFLWGYGIYAGSDGGYWITPLTGLPTMPPPVLYGVSTPEAVKQINQVCAQIMSKGKDAEGLGDVLRQNNIHYVYLGARGGVISPQALQESSQFRQLYHENGTWLFEVLPIP